jgi:hypothetical protein
MTDDSFERAFWGNCVNTYGEETKQLVYADRMQLAPYHDGRSICIDLGGRTVIDIGGGPTSLLLKCKNLGEGSTVIDPTDYPEWVHARYREASIYERYGMKGEQLHLNENFDEAWIYNVLQHVDDPALIVANARRAAKIVRLFEWIDLPPHPGHPHMLTESMLSEALGGPGTVETMNESGCVGRAFYGVWGR